MEKWNRKLVILHRDRKFAIHNADNQPFKLKHGKMNIVLKVKNLKYLEAYLAHWPL